VHDVKPSWHKAVGGVHLTFAVHAVHEPLLHTSFVPQDVPSALAVVASVHVATPFVQADTVP
jgi:hypothetical protein